MTNIDIVQTVFQLLKTEEFEIREIPYYLLSATHPKYNITIVIHNRLLTNRSSVIEIEKGGLSTVVHSMTWFEHYKFTKLMRKRFAQQQKEKADNLIKEWASKNNLETGEET